MSERIGLGDVEEAFAKMKAGTVLRSVVEISRGGTGVRGGDARGAGVAAPAGVAR